MQCKSCEYGNTPDFIGICNYCGEKIDISYNKKYEDLIYGDLCSIGIGDYGVEIQHEDDGSIILCLYDSYDINGLVPLLGKNFKIKKQRTSTTLGYIEICLEPRIR